jgi:hypothetical protein
MAAASEQIDDQKRAAEASQAQAADLLAQRVAVEQAHAAVLQARHLAVAAELQEAETEVLQQLESARAESAELQAALGSAQDEARQAQEAVVAAATASKAEAATAAAAAAAALAREQAARGKAAGDARKREETLGSQLQELRTQMSCDAEQVALVLQTERHRVTECEHTIKLMEQGSACLQQQAHASQQRVDQLQAAQAAQVTAITSEREAASCSLELEQEKLAKALHRLDEVEQVRSTMEQAQGELQAACAASLDQVSALAAGSERMRGSLLQERLEREQLAASLEDLRGEHSAVLSLRALRESQLQEALDRLAGEAADRTKLGAQLRQLRGELREGAEQREAATAELVRHQAELAQAHARAAELGARHEEALARVRGDAEAKLREAVSRSVEAQRASERAHEGELEVLRGEHRATMQRQQAQGQLGQPGQQAQQQGGQAALGAAVRGDSGADDMGRSRQHLQRLAARRRRAEARRRTFLAWRTLWRGAREGALRHAAETAGAVAAAAETAAVWRPLRPFWRLF